MCNSFNISGYFLNSNILIPFQTRTTTIEPFATHVLKKVIASWSLWPFCLYSRISVCLTNTPSTLNVVWVGLGASFFAMIQIINARQFNGERVSSIPSRHYFANVDSNCVRHKKVRQVCTYLTYQTKTKCYFLRVYNQKPAIFLQSWPTIKVTPGRGVLHVFHSGQPGG